MAAITDWYYATAGGGLYLGVDARSEWTTGPVGLQTTPAVKEGVRKVWAGTLGGDLITFDALHGNVTRSVSLAGAVFYTGCHGPNLIVAMADGRIFGIDPETEAIRWTAQVDGKVLVAAETSDVLLVLPFEGTAAIAIDAVGGAVLWHTPYPGSTVSADNGVFYLANFEDMLEARRAADGAVLWSVTNAGSNYSSVNTYGGTVYAATEDLKLYAMAEAGGAVQWSANLPGFPATPLYAGRGTPGASLIVPFGNTGGPPSPGIAAYDAATGGQHWIVGPLAGGDSGERPIFPLMRFYAGCIGLPNEGLVYFYDVGGRPLWPQAWNVGPNMSGLAYLNGEIPAWPKP